MEPIVLAPPRPADPPAVERGWRRWEALPGGEARDAAKEAAREPPWRTVLDGLFGGSPFLSEALLAEPEVLGRLVRDGAEAAFGALLAEVEDLDVGDRARLALGLRRSRRRVALLVGLADLAGLWPLEGVTTALTRFADLAVGRVVDHLLGEAVRRGELLVADPARPAAGSGLVVLAMGKHGAGELNYSSDIDLIVLFDEERFRYRGGESAMALRGAAGPLARLPAREQDRGRLRLPHRPPAAPASCPAIRSRSRPTRPSSTTSGTARTGSGRRSSRRARSRATWRPAARSCAASARSSGASTSTTPPSATSTRSSARSTPTAASATIRRARPRPEGGPRRHPRDRVLRPDPAAHPGRARAGACATRGPASRCAALAEPPLGRAGRGARADRALPFLRALEHRLQMVADKQTQALPGARGRVRALRRVRRLRGREALEAAVLGGADHGRAALRGAVRARARPRRPAAAWCSPAPATTPTRSRPWPRWASRTRPPISARIRGWHHGHIRATRSTRARELLTELHAALSRRSRSSPTPTPRSAASTSSSPACRPACRCSRCSARTRGCSTLLIDLTGVAPRLAGSSAAMTTCSTRC